MTKHFYDKTLSLCESCGNACGKCSWSDGTFTPIDGWDAIPTRVHMLPVVVDSYLVKSCPQFVPDGPKHTDHIVSDRVTALMCAICERAIRDYAECVIRYRALEIDYKTCRLNAKYDMRFITARDFLTGPLGEEMLHSMGINVDGKTICNKIDEDPQGVLNRFYEVCREANQERTGATRTSIKYQNALKRAERNQIK